LIFSASSLPIFSLSGFGAPSTSSFASFKPKPVTVRTSLITAIFFASSKAFNITVNSVFSSSPPAAPAAGAAAATATGAAAETPNFYSIALTSSEISRTVLEAIASKISSLLNAAILSSP
jgi:hypothetical protein